MKAISMDPKESDELEVTFSLSELIVDAESLEPLELSQVNQVTKLGVQYTKAAYEELVE